MTQVKIFMFFGDFEWVLQPKMGFWDVPEHGNVLTNLIMHLKNILPKILVENTRSHYVIHFKWIIFLDLKINKNKLKSANYFKY